MYTVDVSGIASSQFIDVILLIRASKQLSYITTSDAFIDINSVVLQNTQLSACLRAVMSD